jgi:hypothetical protein
MSKSFRYAVVSAVLLTMVLGFAAPALAHEERTVGAYKFTVGWGSEPTYAGFQNSVQLILHNAKGQAVTDLGDSLKVTVINGTQSMTFGLETTFDPDSGEGTPGDYRAYLIPTRPGNYTFHFTGTIHGQKVDQTFTSSATTFDPVKDPSEVMFPAKDPSAGDLANRIQAVDSRTGLARTAADKGKSTANTALILAIVGLVLGAGGVMTGLVTRRKKPV